MKEVMATIIIITLDHSRVCVSSMAQHLPMGEFGSELWVWPPPNTSAVFGVSGTGPVTVGAIAINCVVSFWPESRVR